MRSSNHGALCSRLCRAIGHGAIAVALLAACGPREPALSSPGMSTANPIASSTSTPGRDAAARWEGFADIAAFRPMGKPFLSRGHFAGRWKAQVLVNEVAAQVYPSLSRASHFAPGAVLLKRHADKTSGEPGPLFLMVKREPGSFPRGGDWDYLVIDNDGWVEDRGPLVACARCHAEATADWVFGLPVDARP